NFLSQYTKIRIIFKKRKECNMDELEIRENRVSLNGQELKTLTEFEIKNIVADGCAEVKMSLTVKLV
ncbi:hypothetical protein ABXW34_24775, partial [Streptococcus suis]